MNEIDERRHDLPGRGFSWKTAGERQTKGISVGFQTKAEIRRPHIRARDSKGGRSRRSEAV